MLGRLTALLGQPEISVEQKSEEQEEDVWIKIISSTPSLNNNKITSYFNCEPLFNGVFSKNNLVRVKDRAYVINRDAKKSKVTH